MAYIPPDKVKEILKAANADIAGVIGAIIPLEISGKHYKACCPFHQEKKPSFIITPEKGIYKCFGCGRSGTAFKFVQEYERLSFMEALTKLANHFNIQI